MTDNGKNSCNNISPSCMVIFAVFHVINNLYTYISLYIGLYSMHRLNFNDRLLHILYIKPELSKTFC